MYTPIQIADYFLLKLSEDKGDTISPLKLQKLVYYAQAWHYTIFSEPLFDERIEAWVNGPVTPSIYAKYAGTLKNQNIDLAKYPIIETEFPNNTALLLNDVSNIYGERSGSYLENLTHSERPWIEARGILPPYAKCKAEITLESMKTFYSQFRNEQ